ncbi:VOC family protein [Bradyrhizobium tropiciagri]|uniref:VOC family protein n=1 Tax=Bradyrhizobium tropiciagri TaxID=312253 RepID=UPI001BA43E61|nr:VOC family protein [Bradyrhizobium tropiciagri]MBR0873275.1 VOC family protein [Bradyrhizobium tropiciagri]
MKVKHVYLTASHPARLAEFYAKAGLSIRFADGERWIQFRTEGAAFCVSGLEESASTPSTNAVVVFEVDHLEPVLDRVVAAGATLIAPVRDMGSHGRVAQVRDPDGNVIQFFEAATKPNE